MAPQLPLYTLDQAAMVETITYAQVVLGECKFIGVSDQQPFGIDRDGGFKVPQLSKHPGLKNVFTDWEQMVAFWLRSLSAIAAEFLSGDARVDPEGNGLCKHCKTPTFCRSGDYIPEEPES